VGDDDAGSRRCVVLHVLNPFVAWDGLRGAGAAGDVEQTAAETDAADLESPAEYSSGRPTGPRPSISSCAVLASSSRLSVPPMGRCRHARPFASATTQVWVAAE
jgi:hypothetical protein